MGYRYLDDLATADIAFEATGEDVEQVFVAAAEATMNVMVEELQSIEARVERIIEKEDAELDMLLFDMLQEIVYYKDAEQLLLRVRGARDHRARGGVSASGPRGWRKARPPAPRAAGRCKSGDAPSIQPAIRRRPLEGARDPRYLTENRRVDT